MRQQARAFWIFNLLTGLLVMRAGAATNHWAFQPLRTVRPPQVQDSKWVKNPVDRFILAGLEAQRLQPALPATREELIRRLTFGLIGLPPTPEEIDAFVHDSSANAYETLIDRLLSSPHYGERWARHWLDLARYAESDGFEHDAVRPHAWRYRDYVIDSFSADKPYDRFLHEQIAGDELWPDRPEALIATGFNLLGPDMVDSADQVQRRLNSLNDMTDTMASAVLGLTLACARCHDHKFEPFTQRDYFSLQAFFTPAQFDREQPVPTAAERQAHQAARAKYDERTSSPRQVVRELEAPYREKLYQEKLAKLSEDAQLAHRTPKAQRTKEQEGTVQETAPQVKVTDEDVTMALSAEDKTQRKKALDQLKKIPAPAPLPEAMVLADPKSAAAKTYVLVRGDYATPGEEVEAAFPAVLRSNPPISSSIGVRSQEPGVRGQGIGASESQTAQRSPNETERVDGKRAALAHWLTSPKHPLTARVMVNRIWQHHFGHAFVATPSDFGTRGTPPTHPELLDWLAQEFVQGGWSIKQMHKLILLSAAYQQSSRASAGALERDPANRLFSRQNRLRLEGEAVRDSLLAVSGRLNRSLGGASVWPPIPAEITKTSKNWKATPEAEEYMRRSIYIFARRNLRFPFLEAFDAPDSNLSCPERGQSTTAPQALTLLNSEAVTGAAQATAQRVLLKAPQEIARIEFAYRLILGRRPTNVEMEMTRTFLAETRARIGEEETRAWSEVCRALFNLNAFVYVD